MKLATWNINGLRAKKKPLSQILRELDADIVCIQETKITREQLDESHALIDGYSSYFSFCKAKSGYSGVATYCRDSVRPLRAQEGLTGLLHSPDGSGASAGGPVVWRCTEADVGTWTWPTARHSGDSESCAADETGTTAAAGDRLPQSLLMTLDSEGRAVLTQHIISSESCLGTSAVECSGPRLLTVINVYCPCVNPEKKDDRETFRLQFLNLLGTVVRRLVASGSSVIVAGDLNVAHRPIDHCDPGDLEEFTCGPARRWLDALLVPAAAAFVPSGCGSSDDSAPVLVDVLRLLHPDAGEQAYTCWNTASGARLTNYGTRIDYVLLSADLAGAPTGCDTLQHYDGSDHCPVVADCRGLLLLPAAELPPSCSSFLAKFKVKQRKLSHFLLTGRSPATVAAVATTTLPGGGGAASLTSTVTLSTTESQLCSKTDRATLQRQRSLTPLQQQLQSSECHRKRGLARGGRQLVLPMLLRTGQQQQDPLDQRILRQQSEQRPNEEQQPPAQQHRQPSGPLLEPPKPQRVAASGKRRTLAATAAAATGNAEAASASQPSAKRNKPANDPPLRKQPSPRQPTIVEPDRPLCSRPQLNEQQHQAGGEASDEKVALLTCSTAVKHFACSLRDAVPAERHQPAVHCLAVSTSFDELVALSRPQPSLSPLPKATAKAVTLGSCCNSGGQTTVEPPIGVSRGERLVASPLTNSSEATAPAAASEAIAGDGCCETRRSAWQALFKPPPPVPKCRRHAEPCALRTVRKAGPNNGRQFYVCPRPVGRADNPLARCDHFEWAPSRR